jgi:hypothetical protein
MKTFKRQTILFSGSILVLLGFFTNSAFSINIIPADTLRPSLSNKEISQKKKSFKMTTLTFGGNGINVSKINNQLSVMTGGRGSATFNNRFTIGGGGWGMTKGVEVESNVEGTYNFVKMGYGGIDFGYLLFPREKFNLGTKLLIAGGAVFKETVPESKDKGFKLFPVLEPTLYYQVSLGRLFRFEMGASYRFIRGTDLPYISDRSLSGFSCYLGFLVSACTCN